MDTKLSSVGPYKVEQELGRGGMGVVYLGIDTRLDRKVAIKALPEALAGDAERMARLEREAKILAALNHANIAGIYGYEEKDGAFYLVLEYVEGPTLAERLAEGPMAVTEALELAAQIAAGIAAAHEAGVVHRDLKPGNIKLASENRVKVLDFGLAKMAGGDSDSGPHLSESPTRAYAETRDGIILGTAGYMSPEQARGKAVDRRTDLWALGCILYEMLTGRQAFRGETISDTLAAVLRGEPDWGILPTATPASVRRLLRRCLEKDPRKRLRDASDARIELEEALAEPPGTPVSGMTAAAMARGLRPVRVVMFGVAILVAGALVGTWFGGRQGGGTTSQGRGGAVTRLSLSLPETLSVHQAILSPDGRTVGFVGYERQGEDSGKSRLYLRPLDRFAAKALEGTEGARGIGYSSDGTWIYYPVAGEDRTRLFRIPADGSAPPVQVDEWTQKLESGMQLPGGDLLFFQIGAPALFRMPLGRSQEGRAIPLDLGGLRGELRTLSPLPSDKAALVGMTYYSPRGFLSGVGVVDLTTGKVRLVVEEGGNARYHHTGHLVFTRGDTLLAVPFDLSSLEPRGTPVALEAGLRTEDTWAPALFDLAGDGTLLYPSGGRAGANRQLAVVGHDGKVSPWAGEYRSFIGALSLSPDGTTCAAVITNEEGIDEIWLWDTRRPGLRRFAALPSVDLDFPLWTPDGKGIVYQRTAHDAEDGIYIQPLVGGAPVRLVHRDKGAVLLRPWGWTPEGDLLTTVRTASIPETLVLPKGSPDDPSSLRPLFAGVPGAFEPAFSPDGTMVAYGVMTGDGTELLLARWRPGSDPSDPQPISAGKVLSPFWSRDGKRLYFLAGRAIMAAEVKGGKVVGGESPKKIADLEGLSTSFLWGGLSVLPDGRLLFVQRGPEEGATTSFNLVLGWERELIQKVPTAAN